jgi:hypothetical protein
MKTINQIWQGKKDSFSFVLVALAIFAGALILRVLTDLEEWWRVHHARNQGKLET